MTFITVCREIDFNVMYFLFCMCFMGHVVAQWLRHYATILKVVGWRPDEVNESISIYLILPATLGPGVFPASNRNEYQKQKNNVSEE
jgi:hypothetical protein